MQVTTPEYPQCILGFDPWFVRILKAIVAIILIQTLYFKFSGAEESVFIFSKLGVEPWGRIGAAIAELLIVILLFLPRTSWMGALLGIGTMFAAVGSHLFIIGIEVYEDGGLLFSLAIVCLIGCISLLAMEKESAKIFFARIQRGK